MVKPGTSGSNRKQQIRVSRSASIRMIFGGSLKYVSFALIAILLLYLSFAATVVRIVPSFSTGPEIVKNMTYPGGIAPRGEILMVDMEQSQDTGVIGRLEQAFIPGTHNSVVKVVAGPYGEMSWTQPDILSVDGEPIDRPVPSDKDGNTILTGREDNFLHSEYLVECVEGDCEKGSVFIISKDNILGTVV